MGHGDGQGQSDDGGDPQPTQSPVPDLLAAQTIAAQLAGATGNRWVKECQPGGNQSRKRAYDCDCCLNVLALDRSKVFGTTTGAVCPSLRYPTISVLRNTHVQYAVKIIHPDKRRDRTIVNVYLLFATAHA